MSKQDRQGVRTPADIERKYDLVQDSKIIDTVNNALRTAERARTDVEDLSRRIEGLEGMDATVYDPQEKKQDIFAYVDEKILGAIEGSY